MFGQAVIWAGEADWRHFVTGPGEMLPHIRAGWRTAADTNRFRPIDRDTAIAPGVTAVLAPGHTPGHLCVVLSSGAQRALLLGDAVTCPVQLDEPAWHSLGDVDPVLAAGPGNACGANSKTTARSAPVRIFPSFSSAGCCPEWPGAGMPPELSCACLRP